MEPITIDLDAVGAGAHGQSIRRDALERVLTKLVAKPETSPEQDDRRRLRPLTLDVMSHRRHDAIMVSARRGDGKTTFLTAILRLIQDVQTGRDTFARHLPDGQASDKICSLYSLGIIDPTLIETKQNIVIIIIEKIKIAVDRAHELHSQDDKGGYDDFKKMLYELASGLTLLDGIGDEALYGKDWADPDYILDKGLDRARSAGAFERAFHRYVAQACKFVGIDAFVLAIDDVDTSFERGWPVLESLRKYLATPQLKVILAGDIKLYNLLTRQQQWKQMTPGFLDAEGKFSNEDSYFNRIIPMIDTLQDQYLVKIVAPENRVDLRPLVHYAEQPGIEFKSSMSGGSTKREKEFLNDYSERLLAIRDTDDRALIRMTLLRLPLRSSLQALAGAWGLVNPTMGLETENVQVRLRALDALRHVASTRLMNLDLDENELRDPDPDRIFGVLSLWMTNKDSWLSMARLHPEGDDEDHDLSSLFLASAMVELFRRRPRAMVDYWLRICTIREKIDRGEAWQPQAQNEMPTPSQNMLRELLDHLRATANERSMQFVSRLASWEVGGGSQIARDIRISGATVPATSRLREVNAVALELYGLNVQAFDRQTFTEVANGSSQEHKDRLQGALPAPLRGYHKALMTAGWPYSSGPGTEAGFIVTFANSLESLKAGLTGSAAAIAMLPASRVTSGQQAENGNYSLLRLIAFLGDVLNLAPTVATAGPPSGMQELLDRSSFLQSYPVPSTSTAAVPSADQEDSTDDSEDPDGADRDDTVPAEAGSIVELLRGWLKTAYEPSVLPPVAPITLARIWTRFSNAILSIRHELRHTRTRYLGILMHRAIIAFMHAIGVEILRAAGHSLPAKIVDNPIKSGGPFLSLLNHIEALQQSNTISISDLRFFYTIFSFPVWGYFLARRDEDITGTVRSSPTDAIFKKYEATLSKFASPPPSYEVTFRHRDGQIAATFDGLFFLLNTVQLQGQHSYRDQRVAAGLKLSDELARLKGELAKSKAETAPPSEPAVAPDAPKQSRMTRGRPRSTKPAA
jgi:hypothetical protein